MKKLLLMLSVVSAQCFADPMDAAVAEYKLNGSKAFIETLLKESPVKILGNQLISTLAEIGTIETTCGKIMGVDLVRRVEVSPKVTNSYYVMNYENCPAYICVETYKTTANAKVATSFSFNSAIYKVLPNSLIEGK